MSYIFGKFKTRRKTEEGKLAQNRHLIEWLMGVNMNPPAFVPWRLFTTKCLVVVVVAAAAAAADSSFSLKVKIGSTSCRQNHETQ